ncbi:MAG: N(4)-(beta-N-acetylglucosaminyl)-L-asparaginase [Candidatus Aminicenantes bacterium]
MAKQISRRKFFKQGFGLGAGAWFVQKLPLQQTGKSSRIPMIVTSHTNETGKKAVHRGWEILVDGGSALDAVEKAANIIELDPEGMGVGFGGLPNEDGVVQLDASIMDGRTYNAGAVACLENIKTPCSVARLVMERTDHVMLVGRDALEFAKKWGFKEENLLTDKARQVWLRWKEEWSDRDDWGPPEHLRNISSNNPGSDETGDHVYGTTNVLAVDKNSHIAGITTTSGLSFKIAGRVGDSPIIGAGLYVDNEVGAAGATGRGEDVIKSCASFYMILRMKERRTPQQACQDALKMIVDKYKKINPEFFPFEQFVAINKKGEWGCARMRGRRKAAISVMNRDGYTIHKGPVVFPSER